MKAIYLEEAIERFIQAGQNLSKDQIIYMLNRLPTTEIVKCKDCKWAKETRMKSIDGDVIVWKTCPSRTEVIEDDDFCSYGERSEE